MNSGLIPLHRSKDVKQNFEQNIEAWKNFAQRITKNLFVKNFLLKRDGSHCSWCKRTMNENFAVHHISYYHCCTFKKVTVVSTPTPSNPNNYRIVPDCESCKKENEKRFLECMDKLALVHSSCNKEISDSRKHFSQSQQGTDSSATFI
jgi:hypothetical protein